MIHLSNFASALRRQAAALSVLGSVLVFASAASAATLDFNVPNGNFLTPGNWVDSTAVTGMNPIPVPTSAVPTIADNAYIRNGGTVTINSNVSVLQIRVGMENTVTNPDYDNDGTVNAGDYVLWRKGGPLANDGTPGVTADDYNYWRYRFGGTPLTQQIGQPGTLLWTAGEITGQGIIGTDTYSGGPDIRVGRTRTTNSVVEEVPGTVIQNGATTKILLTYQQSQLTIDDGTAFSHNPTSSYTLQNGTIGTAVGSSLYQNNGSNGNSGILVRSGTFTMNGGQIIDVTPTDYLVGGLVAQRFLTVSTATGGGVGNENVGTANLNGGTINSLGGIRVGTANNSRGYLNLNGTTIVSGGDTSIGYEPTSAGHGNGVGVMTMTAGSFQVGRTDIANQGTGTALKGRFSIGDRGRGSLDMSGGTITVTRDIRVGGRNASGGSIITMTGGTILTPGLDMGNTNTDPLDPPDPSYAGASIIIDGPSAVFTVAPVSFPDPSNVMVAQTGTTTIGDLSKSLFEVRQGTATLGGGGSTIELAKSATSAATINLKGGKLTLGGQVNRTTLTSTPVVNLTGGTLEFNNTTTSAVQQFRTDLIDNGSKLVLKPNAIQPVQVGSLSPAFPANFAMNSGSWDIEIGSHAVAGADSFNVANGTAALAGGTLNISYISGYTPTAGDIFNIVTSNSVPTVGAVTIAGSGSPNWILDILGNVIRLKYTGSGSGAGGGLGASAVPEPSSIALLVFAVAGLLGKRGSRKRA